MKKKLLIILLVIILLDWAALDDITTGQEPSLLGEYFMVIISIPTLLVIGYLIYRSKSSTFFLRDIKLRKKRNISNQ